MLATGNQLRAARSLIGMEQADLALAAGVSINTIRLMEKRGGDTLTSSLTTVKKVQEALERAGVEFLNHGRQGVQLKTAPLSHSGDRENAAQD